MKKDDLLKALMLERFGDSASLERERPKQGEIIPYSRKRPTKGQGSWSKGSQRGKG